MVYSANIDRWVSAFDHALRTLTDTPMATRANPAAAVKAPELSAADTRHAGGLMRVNHSGEICAQALYHGQAVAARDATTAELIEP